MITFWQHQKYALFAILLYAYLLALLVNFHSAHPVELDYVCPSVITSKMIIISADCQTKFPEGSLVALDWFDL